LLIYSGSLFISVLSSGYYTVAVINYNALKIAECIFFCTCRNFTVTLQRIVRDVGDFDSVPPDVN